MQPLSIVLSLSAIHAETAGAAKVAVHYQLGLLSFAMDDLSPLIFGSAGPVRVPEQLVEMHDRESGDLPKLGRKRGFSRSA